MLSLTKKTDYALVALALLGKKRRKEPTATVSAREISDLLGIPLPVLMNVLKELAKARLVTSVRGAAGGYTLALDPTLITVLEVITAIEGPVRLSQCSSELEVVGQRCAVACNCPIQSAVYGLHQRLSDFLEQTTLADLIDNNNVKPASAGLVHVTA